MWYTFTDPFTGYTGCKVRCGNASPPKVLKPGGVPGDVGSSVYCIISDYEARASLGVFLLIETRFDTCGHAFEGVHLMARDQPPLKTDRANAAIGACKNYSH